jgi:CelD/BcsL family acetyltransferase involved in cellulose biosynthesis
MPVRLVSTDTSGPDAPPKSGEPLLLAIDDPRWSSFVSETRTATPFHDPEWARLLASTYRYSAFAIGISDDDGRLVAGAPFVEVRKMSRRRRWVSLPFTDECPPLVRDATAERAFSAALAMAHERLGAPALEVRGMVEGCGWQTNAEAVIHELELTSDLASVRKGFSKGTTRNIARAEREGVTVRHAADARDLDAFYRLHTHTRRRQGVPVQPRNFFDHIWSRLVEPGFASILLADVGDSKAVAACLFMWGGGSTVYKFGASDDAYLRFRPNHLILWTAIQEACARGDHRFDFGRTDLGNGGLRAFKSSWGAPERALRYSSLTPGAADGAEGVASRALGAAIRRGPSWVCRGTGAALYRYAGSR